MIAQLLLFQIVHEQAGLGREILCALGIAGVQGLLRLIEEVANLPYLFPLSFSRFLR